MFHAGYGRFSLESDETTEFIKSNLSAIAFSTIFLGAGAATAAARLFAFLINLDGISDVVMGATKLPLPFDTRKRLAAICGKR